MDFPNLVLPNVYETHNLMAGRGWWSLYSKTSGHLIWEAWCTVAYGGVQLYLATDFLLLFSYFPWSSM